MELLYLRRIQFLYVLVALASCVGFFGHGIDILPGLGAQARSSSISINIISHVSSVLAHSAYMT